MKLAKRDQCPPIKPQMMRNSSKAPINRPIRMCHAKALPPTLPVITMAITDAASSQWKTRVGRSQTRTATMAASGRLVGFSVVTLLGFIGRTWFRICKAATIADDSGAAQPCDSRATPAVRHSSTTAPSDNAA